VDGLTAFCDAFATVPGNAQAIKRYVETHEISGVSAVDDTTLVLRLKYAAPEILNLLAIPAASPIPAEYLDYLPDSPEFRQHTLSNGPYRIAEYIQNRSMLMERNPAWSAASDPLRPAYVDRISIRLGADPQLQQLQIEAGTADMGVEPLRGSDVGPMLAINDPTMWLSPPGERFGLMAYLIVNHLSANNAGALRKRDVRRAISLAINRAAIVQVSAGPRVTRRLYQAVPSSWTGFAPGADRDVTPGDLGDPDAARTLLAKAGYPDGVTLTLAYPIYGSFPVMSQVLQASLARAGVDIRLVPLITGDLYGRLLGDVDNARRGEWDLVLTGMLPDWFGANNARTIVPPMFDGRLVESNSPNYGGYRSAAADSAIDRAIAAPTCACVMASPRASAASLPGSDGSFKRRMTISWTSALPALRRTFGDSRPWATALRSRCSNGAVMRSSTLRSSSPWAPSSLSCAFLPVSPAACAAGCGDRVARCLRRQGCGVRSHREGRAHAPAGRDADPAGAGVHRLCRHTRALPQAHHGSSRLPERPWHWRKRRRHRRDRGAAVP
jgi:hypothetical protein